MHKPPENIDLLLPQGEALRGFLEQSFITSADLRHTLRSRGIFLNRNEKSDTIPILVCCLLSPREFDELRECQLSHEDNPKTMTRTLPWHSRRSLIEAIPTDLKLAELIAGEFVNYKIIGSPAFVPVGNNPNIIACEFEIEREDYSQSWAAIKSVFKGRLRIEKNTSGSAIKFILTHTASETKDLNRKFVKHLTQTFKRNGDVKKDAEIETILFSSFDNERRFAFFQSLVGNGVPAGFESVGITDLGICPDPSLELPPNVSWMENKDSGLKINGVAFNGVALQDIFLLKDSGYHRFFFLHSIEAKFKFDCNIAKGSCLVVFEFPDFMREKDSSTEFEVNIPKLNLDATCSELNKVEVKEELLRRINEFKLSQFEKFKLRPLAQSAVQLEATMDWG